MADISIEVPPPLENCFRHCEVDCVRECCGIDAISTDPELIGQWANNAGTDIVNEAIRQLSHIVSIVEDRSHKVTSTFLNHYTCDEAARKELLVFLGAFYTTLSAAASTQ